MVAPGKTLTLHDKIRTSTIRVEILIKIPFIANGYVGILPTKTTRVFSCQLLVIYIKSTSYIVLMKITFRGSW